MFRQREESGGEVTELHRAVGQMGRIATAVAIGTSLTAFLFLPVQSHGGTDGDEPDAAILLERARAHRETLSAEFPGFRSKLVVRKDGELHEGRMTFRPPVTLDVEFGDAAVRKSLKRTVRSLLSHRMAPTRSGNTEDRTITYGEKDSHPLGRRIFLGDKYGSSYRIHDNRILEVDRNMEDSRLLITVMETETTPLGRYLPTHFFVATFDKESGAVKHSSAYRDAYQQVGGEYLPRSRRIVSTAAGRTEVLLVDWEEIELLSPVKAD